jgi:hypothetical protein
MRRQLVEKKQRNEEWYDDECRGAIKRRMSR